MTKEQAGALLAGYLKPIFGFALRRCKSIQDAEDLSQEIVMKALRSLSARDDVDDAERFIWTIAHHTLANYYRDASRQYIGLPEETQESPAEAIEQQETIAQLHREIAYLSRQQREILIAYYFEHRRQSEIAQRLRIPLGTVKWHLFEAKKELKRSMSMTREYGVLKFNPIRFDFCGTSGRVGTKGVNANFFRSALSQNIAYATLREAKTVAEIADALGVSPVYVESEAEYLAEYGFLAKRGEKYLCSILIEEPDARLAAMQDEMYARAAKLFAREVREELLASGLLECEGLIVGEDVNFALWALIPYIAACSGAGMLREEVTFEEAATHRPDGGHNICYATVSSPEGKNRYWENMKHWCGPCWNDNERLVLWQIDSEWSQKRVDDQYQVKAQRDLTLLGQWMEHPEAISPEDYAYLAQRGYLRTEGEVDGLFRATAQFVWIRDEETNRRILDVGDRVRRRHQAELDALKTPYIQAVLEITPAHLRKVQQHSLQYIFFADGWFILYCMKELIHAGLLRLPKEEQRMSLSTILAPAGCVKCN